MKPFASVVVIGLVLNLMAFSPLFSEDKPGFQDVSFGTTYGEVKKVLQKNARANKYGKGVEVSSYEGYLWLKWFKLGEQPVTVTFSFDHKNRFYSFSFDTPYLSASHFDSRVREAGEYLTEVFRKRFGPPAKCFKVNFLDVSSNGLRCLCAWSHPALDINTGLASYDSEFYATAHVSLRSLEQEYIQHQNKTKGLNTTKGARQF